MGMYKFASSTAVAAVLIGGQGASAQVVLPEIDVTASRIVNTGSAAPGNTDTGTASIGIVGASTSVVTSEQIRSSPAQNLPDILAQQTGIQLQSLFSGTNGSRTTVDLRGFGAFAQSNVLILVDGRRYQDFDFQGFDFSSIPLDSIERIEITRGNSGTVLYGDGAIGGVINIVTKKKLGPGLAGRVEGLAGSFGYREGRASASAVSGPWSVALFGDAINSNGYRVNSALRQRSIDANINYADGPLSGYLRIAGDRQSQGLPAGLNNLPSLLPYTLDTPWQSNTPLDRASKQGINLTAGVTATLAPGVDLILDGGVRRKFQQAQFFNYFLFDPVTFATAYTVAGATPMNYVDTVMTTTSFTPRFDVHHNLFGAPGRLLAGVDVYNTQYISDRPTAPGLVPVHSYDIRQLTTAFYAMNTSTIRPDTDVSFGGRLQRNAVKAQDVYSAVNDPNAGFYANNPQAPSLDMGEWQWAAHAGIEHRLSPSLAVLARAARAFRLGNADERVGAGGPFVFTPPNFNLKTQTSHDVEGGVRFNAGGLNAESSVYLMRLNNEIHFIPALGIDTNLDPTQRWGSETSASYQLNDALRLKGGVAYTRATFRAGPFAGNDIPLVSRWSGNSGLTWDIVQKLLVLDLTGRFFGPRRMDNDQMNVQPKIPGNATADVKLGGSYDRFFWSAAVLNVFNLHYYDYAIASGGIAAGPFFGGLPPTLGLFSAFPLAGRTFMVRAGATF